MNPTETPTQPAATAPAPTTPSGTWPGAFKIYQTSKAIVKTNVKTIVIVYIVLVAVSLVINVTTKSLGNAGVFVNLLISIIISGIEYGIFTTLYLRSVKGEKVEIGQAVEQGMPYVLKMIGLFVLQTIAEAISFILLIIPIFFVYPRLALSRYFLVDKNMGPLQALNASWTQTKGHSGKVWGIAGVNVLIVLLAVTIIGIPFAIFFGVMYSAANVVLYKFITDGSL